ncbi:MAG: aminotransferase class III-fold pyridoxal phosphate-dependent enzyme, partial [Chitinophagaceae bacterium]
PDIMMLGKALTAGYMGHAATIASEEVFTSFLDEGYEKAFMHGPTFMGNPLSCAVALKSIEIFEQEDYLEKIIRIEAIINEAFSTIESKRIIQKRVLGAMGAIEVSDKKYLEGFKDFAKQQGVWLRPIGKVVYLMPPYIIQEKELLKVLEVIRDWFEK